MTPGTFSTFAIEPMNAGACSGAGEWSADSAAAPIASLNPATGEVLARIAPAGAADYERVLAGASEAFARWRAMPAPRRGELVRRLGELLRQHKDALGTLVSLETGKIKQEGDGEVQEMIDMADFAVGQSRMLYGLTLPSERPRHRMMEQWHPLGVVGVVTAFNFPVAVWAWNAFLAAVCGDTVVWKPSPKAPLCAIAVQRLAVQAMSEFAQPGVFNLLIPADNALTGRLFDDTRVPLLSFTGSSAVGRLAGERVAARFGRSLLECAGNNAVIVDESADLDLAIPAVVFGAVGTAGQRCTSTRRLIVARARWDEVIARLVRAYRQVRIGDPLDPATHMGPLIDAPAVARFRAAVEEAAGAGGELLWGGGVLPGPGFFAQPTLLRASNAWPCVQRETFAPILYVMPFDTIDEAIALANGVPQGLSAALFTGDLRRAEAFVAATGSDCGIANVNVGTSGAEIGGAFGGEKETGGGREAGSDAWKAYMRRQTSTINFGRDLPLAQAIRFVVD